jgi:hypothetical protein
LNRPHLNAVRVNASRSSVTPADRFPHKVLSFPELGTFRVYDNGPVERVHTHGTRVVNRFLLSDSPVARRVRALARAA